jgi:hypothetical protein
LIFSSSQTAPSTGALMVCMGLKPGRRDDDGKIKKRMGLGFTIWRDMDGFFISADDGDGGF